MSVDNFNYATPETKCDQHEIECDTIDSFNLLTNIKTNNLCLCVNIRMQNKIANLGPEIDGNCFVTIKQ